MLDIAMVALVALVKTTLGFDLVDQVAEWFWDGAPEAMAILPEYFPGVPGHMCLQHAKTQQGRRFTVGFKHWAVRNLEMMAFMPGPLFHLSIEALLLRLDLAGQTKGAEYKGASKTKASKTRSLFQKAHLNK